MHEFDFIATLLTPLAHESALGLKDDAALLDIPAGQQLVITKDMLMAGVHFFGDEPAGLIAQKALRVNLSDLAAMGAESYVYFLGLSLPKSTTEAWLTAFCQGLATDQQQYGISLAGGDTTATDGPLTISITALGTVPKGTVLTRSGAKPGDDVWISGTIGDSALGLEIVRHSREGGNLLPVKISAFAGMTDYLMNRYLLPEPRLALGRALRGIATACIDISDGLVQDAGHIAGASGVALTLLADDVPVFAGARADEAYNLEHILTGGDDYELLFTAPAVKRDEALAAAAQSKTSIARIGYVAAGEGAKIVDAHGTPLHFTREGYRHF